MIKQHIYIFFLNLFFFFFGIFLTRSGRSRAHSSLSDIFFQICELLLLSLTHSQRRRVAAVMKPLWAPLLFALASELAVIFYEQQAALECHLLLQELVGVVIGMNAVMLALALVACC